MEDISSTATGMVVGGAGFLLLGVFGVAFRMLILSGETNTQSYDRAIAEADREHATNAELRAEIKLKDDKLDAVMQTNETLRQENESLRIQIRVLERAVRDQP